jgi:hypothetical protein
MAEPFPDSVVREAFARAGGRCECTRTTHPHSGRCPQKLVWEYRGRDVSGGWEAHHRNSQGPATLSNCEILCQDCHKRTRTFGG